MDNKRDFTNVKVGDIVLVYGSNGRWISKVTRVTPKRFEVGHVMFHKHNGSEVGGDIWHSKVAEWLTGEEVAELQEQRERKNIIASASGVALEALTTDQLRRIAAIIRGGKAENG